MNELKQYEKLKRTICLHLQNIILSQQELVKKKKKTNKWVYEFHSVSETDIKDFAKSLSIKTSIAPYNQ